MNLISKKTIFITLIIIVICLLGVAVILKESFIRKQRETVIIENYLIRDKRRKDCAFLCRPNRIAKSSDDIASRIMLGHCLRCLKNPVISLLLRTKRSNNEYSKPSRRGQSNIPSKQKFSKMFTVTTKKPIFLTPDKDYLNNYDDVADMDKVAFDLERLDLKLQKTILYSLMAIIVGAGIIFMLVLPFFQCSYFFCKHPKTYVHYIKHCLVCHDATYDLVEKRAVSEGLKIPEYEEYQRLLEQYPDEKLSELKTKFCKEIEEF